MDIIYYNRNYSTKINKKIIDILFKIKNIFNILIVGDPINGFNNIGIVKRKVLIQYLKKTKFVFATPENLFSFFVLDAISNNAKVISDKKIKKNFLSSYFVYLNKIGVNNIKKIILKRYYIKNSNKKVIINQKKFNDKMLNFIRSHYVN